jgi:AcrR family transcriptional regulator
MGKETITRKERERARHRQEILSAALGLFAEKGYHAVSMQEIATAAEFATGTLYNFFRDKEDLYFELLVSCAESAFGLIMPVLDGPRDERRKVANFIGLHERLAREHRAAIQLFLLERRGRYLPGSKTEAKKKQFSAGLIQQLSEVIAAGVRKGLFNSVDPLIAAKCLTATLEAAVFAAVEDPQGTDLKTDLKGIKTVFFKGLVDGSGNKRKA